jgi:hypothetical protein
MNAPASSNTATVQPTATAAVVAGSADAAPLVLSLPVTGAVEAEVLAPLAVGDMVTVSGALGLGLTAKGGGVVDGEAVLDGVAGTDADTEMDAVAAAVPELLAVEVDVAVLDTVGAAVTVSEPVGGAVGESDDVG